MIHIHRATWGEEDVSEIVRAMIDRGQMLIPASNDSFGKNMPGH